MIWVILAFAFIGMIATFGMVLMFACILYISHKDKKEDKDDSYQG